ncbi:MAG TPA: hypothetical protein DDY79_12765 [Brevundimonas sp.]|nr:hypothetical protein [Brevundimonas sp.]
MNGVAPERQAGRSSPQTKPSAWADSAAEGGPRQEPALEPPAFIDSPLVPTEAPTIDDDEAPAVDPTDATLRRAARQVALDPDDGIPL